ncbi:MAG TPA: hypothetical protein VF796_20720 [Humisphaera sp.]
MTRAVVFDRCVDQARALAARFRKQGIDASAVHPTDLDLTFDDAGGLPDFVVTELQMPMLSGVELIRRVRSVWPGGEPALIAFTTVDDPELWAAARAAGADEVVLRRGQDAMLRLDVAIDQCLGRTAPAKGVTAVGHDRPAPAGFWSRLFGRRTAAAAA